MRDTDTGDGIAASRHPGLLAAKGKARPAMRPQGGLRITLSSQAALGLTDGDDDTAVSDAAPRCDDKPPVVRQREELAEAIAGAAPPPADEQRVPASGAQTAAPKAAFTLRLGADRHLRLRLACTVQNRSAQQIVTAALDRFLDTMPEIERLATTLAGSRTGQNKH